MNKELYGKTIKIPDLLITHLNDSLRQIKNIDKNGEGYKRNVQLQTAKVITYPQLKRIKNFFDNFKGVVTDMEFILNGGLPMKSWVDTTLKSMRDSLEATKRNKTNAGQENQYIRTHEKNFATVRPSKTHLKTKYKHATSLGNLPTPVMEELNRINELIKKII